MHDGTAESVIGVAPLHASDHALVDRLLAGDEAAFDRFFEAHAPGLFRFALLRLHRDADAAEEVVQATLSTAIRKLATYRGEAALFTWLCTFCRHEISAHYRRIRRTASETPLSAETLETRGALESLAAIGDRPDAALERRELAALVRMVLDVLPDRYGDALDSLQGPDGPATERGFGSRWQTAQPASRAACSLHRGPLARLRRAGRCILRGTTLRRGQGLEVLPGQLFDVLMEAVPVRVHRDHRGEAIDPQVPHRLR